MSNHDTTTDNATSPLQEKKPSKAPSHQLGRLSRYLETTFPKEFERQNADEEEATADMAIRLLKQFVSQPPVISGFTRCPAQYCNKPEGHKDEHGWIG